jgi:hypothetical protein
MSIWEGQAVQKPAFAAGPCTDVRPGACASTPSTSRGRTAHRMASADAARPATLRHTTNVGTVPLHSNLCFRDRSAARQGCLVCELRLPGDVYIPSRPAERPTDPERIGWCVMVWFRSFVGRRNVRLRYPRAPCSSPVSSSTRVASEVINDQIRQKTK